jgi:hypothetical protein
MMSPELSSCKYVSKYVEKENKTISWQINQLPDMVETTKLISFLSWSCRWFLALLLHHPISEALWF